MPDIDPLARLGFAAFAGLAGWLAGLASALYSEQLLRKDDLDPPARRGWLVADVLVQAGVAACWVLLALRFGPGIKWLAAAPLAIFLTQVTVTDLRHRFVYLVVVGAGTALGILLGPILHATPWWSSLAGAAGGGLAFLGVYWFGKVLYRGRVEPMARGDIYIAAMVGAMAGPTTVSALFLGILFGGVFAALALALARSRKAFMPYGPGLCLAGLVALLAGNP